MQNFVQLLEDHVQISGAIEELAVIARQPKARPMAAFDALRRLAHLLDAHLRAEEEFLSLDRQNGKGEFTALADEHGANFDDLVCEWTLYLREWDEESMACDWSHFAAKTAWMAQRLNAQVEAENSSLYPAALRHGLVRLLPERARAA